MVALYSLALLCAHNGRRTGASAGNHVAGTLGHHGTLLAAVALKVDGHTAAGQCALHVRRPERRGAEAHVRRAGAAADALQAGEVLHKPGRDAAEHVVVARVHARALRRAVPQLPEAACGVFKVVVEHVAWRRQGQRVSWRHQRKQPAPPRSFARGTDVPHDGYVTCSASETATACWPIFESTGKSALAPMMPVWIGSVENGGA